ncbi:uncharacterized protein MONOS_9491 [Monocercomonoides exilis]|uniref:uncharacterized protein n=1 Tax=Monocercomonoides exilis TaxID=2049356 RepID=UPI003559785F|nr:hypothetical protein MONOS_9491 [Monocercomonoides exilis]|eukprot:MONOS_9491.1-p1 / transcript=MONOS_9491.1 / gene=MONOS_9491 / organism=Monocercomonoides_exilis_PA203 / gene_product=unspecified product / transcript_product=unspecified product / location=Mono_scaffold00394:19415-20932(-) / protein_length=262 / sequence_SO=supercontig / SO=protein_coding / is_pseudo=false
MDFSELAFDRDHAIFGMDKENEGPIDLVPFIVFYKSERIFVSGENRKIEKDCGRKEDPCEKLSEAVRHLNEGSYQKVFVMGKVIISVEIYIRHRSILYHCTDLIPYGHDVIYHDYYNLFSSNNPFCESYTTNTNESRLCYAYVSSNNWYFQHTEKKDWLKEGMKDRYVGVSGNDANNLCGMSEAAPCKTVGHAVGSSMAQLTSTITLLSGRHVSEGTTISVGEKKISVVGRGKTVSVIGRNLHSPTSPTLFSVTSGQLESK